MGKELSELFTIYCPCVLECTECSPPPISVFYIETQWRGGFANEIW